VVDSQGQVEAARHAGHGLHAIGQLADRHGRRGQLAVHGVTVRVSRRPTRSRKSGLRDGRRYNHLTLKLLRAARPSRSPFIGQTPFFRRIVIGTQSLATIFLKSHLSSTIKPAERGGIVSERGLSQRSRSCTNPTRKRGMPSLTRRVGAANSVRSFS